MRHLALLVLAAPIATAVAAAPPARPLDLSTRVLAEVRERAADGTTRIALAAPTRVVPGDRVTVMLDYRNTGTAPIADLVLANPLPAGMAYRGPAATGPAPEVSVDGRRYAPLAQLTLALPGGGSRAAAAADVTHVRWRLARPLAPGTGGTLAFTATIR